MWRVQGFVGRVLHRCHANPSLRLTQSHHVEDEFINSSTALTTSRHSSDGSSQREEDDRRRKKWRAFQFGHNELPRYTALDAVGWGAATVLFMQICRRIHSQFTPGSEPSPSSGTQSNTLQKWGYRIVFEILSRNVLPRKGSSLFLHSQDHSLCHSSSVSEEGVQSSSEERHLITDITDHQAELTPEPLLPDESQLLASFPLQNDSKQENTESITAHQKESTAEEKLTAAALNLGHVGTTGVPVVLNVIGLEQAKTGNYDEAFLCFYAAAQLGYCKAQFNTAVCYEKGRGVCSDGEKALQYYKKAAVGGHRQAQYRYAKLLLQSRGHQGLEELNTAIGFLERASSAGLTKAQVCLASIYSQEPVKDECKSVRYLQMAAQSRDSTALLLLGQCYESGFGVQQNPRTAVEFYKQAAQGGNKQAQMLLNVTGTKDALLRSIHSSPCFLPSDNVSSVAGPVALSAGHTLAVPFLPHSWSTGNVCGSNILSAVPLHLYPRSTDAGSCRWTVGAE
ncbi:death ligand signal enhancer [Neosynchiropus ocellatus]